jgi:transposase
MEWESNMSRDQKEQYVIELYQKGKTIREIAKLVHMSFSSIASVIKNYKEKVEQESGQLEESNDIRLKTKTTQAIKMFSEGSTLIDVAIALDLAPDDVQEMHRQFLQLKNMDELVRVYDKMQNYLPSFLELFRLAIIHRLNPNDVIDGLRIINTGQLEYLQRKLQSISIALNWLEDRIRDKEYYLRSLDNRLREAGIIPMSNSTNEPTYRADYTYPSLPDYTVPDPDHTRNCSN